MEPTRQTRIVIEDLTTEQPLTEEEMAGLLGAGRFRPTLEQLETRELMASSISANLSTGVLHIQDNKANDVIHIREVNNLISIDGASIQVGATHRTSVSASRVSVDRLAANDLVNVDSGALAGQHPTVASGVVNDYLFQSGQLLEANGRGNWIPIDGAIGAEYAATANEKDAYGNVVQKLLGTPTSDEMNVPGVAGAHMNSFQGGAIYWSPTTGAHVVYGAIGTKYNSVGGPAWYGLPITDEAKMPAVQGERVTYFQSGAIYWSAAIGAHLVYGAIGAEYVATANKKDAYGNVVQTLLGAPTSDEMNVPGMAGARMNTFQGGAIYWSPATGAHVVYGAIAQRWLAAGGPGSSLGMPIGDVLQGSGTQYQYFQNGKIVSSAATGVQAIRTVGVPTQADFADMGIDILEIAGGVYSPGRIDINGIDRTAHPLIIRPAPGAAVVWNGGGQPDDGAFYFGLIAPASGFTFDGRNGTGSSWLFTNYNLGTDTNGVIHGTGLIFTAGSHDLKFLGLTFAGNTGIPEGYNSHTFYISNTDSSTASHDIEIAYCKIDGGNQTVTAMQVGHNQAWAAPYNINFHDNEVIDCAVGCECWCPSSKYLTNLTISNNTFTDCGVGIDASAGPQGKASGNVSHNAPNRIPASFDGGSNTSDQDVGAAVIGSYQAAGYTFVAEQDSSLLKLNAWGLQIGSQQFSGQVTGLVYSSAENVTVLGFSDGRMLKVSGVGGTGQNMFAIQPGSAYFDSLPGYSYSQGSQQFSSAVTGLYQAAGFTFIALQDGSLVKVSGTGGTGHNMLALQETGGTITGLSGYSYWQGTQQFSGTVTGLIYSSAQNVTVIGLSDGRMLKVRGIGGTGQNMFAVQAGSAYFDSLPGYSYSQGSQQFSSAVTGLYEVADFTFIALQNGSLVKVNGTGGTGHNMLALQETGSTITGLSGYNYWQGTQQFSGQVTGLVYSPSENVTVISLSDGRILKIHGTGGTGQDMFAIQENASGGFTSLPGYNYYQDGGIISRRFLAR